MRAEDLDDSKTNGTFDFRIVSVTPQDPDIDFVIEQMDNVGKISFKGCLDYEVSGPPTLSRDSAMLLSSVFTLFFHYYYIDEFQDKNRTQYRIRVSSGFTLECQLGIHMVYGIRNKYVYLYLLLSTTF